MEPFTSNMPGEDTPRTNTIITGDFGSYLIQELKGEGVYGKVARCVDLSANTDVVVKFSRQDHISKQEANLLQRLSEENHKNVVRFIDSFCYQQHHCLVLEHLDISLWDYVIQASEDISISDIRDVTMQMLSALQMLGKYGLVHADLKPDNVMLVDQCRPLRSKLIDFGETRTAVSLFPGVQIQAMGYQAPEVMLGGKMCEAIDMWGLGCVLAFVFTTDHLFPRWKYEVLRVVTQICGMPDLQQLEEGLFTKSFFIKEHGHYRLKTPMEYYKKTKRRRYNDYYCLEDIMAHRQPPQTTEEEEATKQFFELLHQMLQVNPTKRISVKKALNHPFVCSNKPEKEDEETATSTKKKSSITHRVRKWFRNLMKRGDKASKPRGRHWPPCCFKFSSAKEKIIQTSQKINVQVKPDLANNCKKERRECWTESSAQKPTTANDKKTGDTVLGRIGRFLSGMFKTKVRKI